MAKILASSQVTIMDINEQISLSSRIDCNIAQIQNISNTNTYTPSWSSPSPAILSGILNRVGLLTDNIITSQDVKSIKWYYKLAARDNNFIEVLTSNPAFELVGTSGKQTQLKIIQNIMTKEYPGLIIRCEIKYQEEWMLSPHLQISDMSFTLSSQGNNGTAGSTGPAGKGISSSAITYQASSSGTTVPTGSWGTSVPTVAAGQYLWTRTIISYTDATTSTSYSIGKMGEQGPQGDKGDQGEALEIFDGVFNEGTRFWSTIFNSYVSPNNDTVSKSANTSIFGGKTLKITNEVWLYSKNPIPIEDDKIYKFVYRVRQLQNPSDTTKNKVYAGATEFSHDGKKISVNNGNYFTASAVSLPVKWKSISGDSAPTNYDPAKDDQYEWTIFEKYMSTSSKTAITYGASIKFPAVSAFTSGTKYIKPMCIVNYTGGNGIAEIDCLNVEDVTSQYEAAKESANKINNDSQEIFDKVTDEGVKQGLFSKDGKVYVNSQYINTRNFVARDNSNNMTFAIDDNGNVTIKPTTFSLSPSTSNQTTMVNLLNNNGSSTSDTNGIYLAGGKIYINGENIKANSITGQTLTGNNIKGGTIGIGGTLYDSFTVDSVGNVKISKGSININSGKFIVESNGNITTAGTVNVGNKFKIDAAGVATMDNITATNLTVNTGTFKGSINVNNKFSVDGSGNLSINGGIFNVNNAGAMNCSNASITGGSLTIGSNFSVTNTGVLTAKSGKIAGYTITGNQLVGSNVGMSGLNGEGVAFWAGSNTAASAPFRVTHAGNLTATGVNITGNINSGSNITGATITSSKTVNGINYSINLDGAKMTSSTENTSTIESVMMEGNSLTLSQSYKDSMTKGTKTNLTYSGLVIWDHEGFAPAVTLDAYGTLNSGNVATFSGNIYTSGRIRIPNSSSCIEAKDTSGTYRNLAYISGGDSSYFGKGLYDAGIGQTMICGNTLWLRSNDRIYFQIAGNTSAINTNSIEFIPISGSSYFRPTVTDVTRLGSASQLWNIVYSKGGVNTTSDRNSKENIKYIYKDNTCFSNEDMYRFMKNDYLLAQYNYIGDPIEDEKISAIAQDLLVNEDGTDNKLGQLIVNCQDAIEMNKEGETPKLSINQTQLLNIAIGALQKTMDKVEALEQELANLRTT